MVTAQVDLWCQDDPSPLASNANTWDLSNWPSLPSGKHTKSYWKWPFIVSFPIKKWWFSIVMLVYQSVPLAAIASLVSSAIYYTIIYYNGISALSVAWGSGQCKRWRAWKARSSMPSAALKIGARLQYAGKFWKMKQKSWSHVISQSACFLASGSWHTSLARSSSRIIPGIWKIIIFGDHHPNPMVESRRKKHQEDDHHWFYSHYIRILDGQTC